MREEFRFPRRCTPPSTRTFPGTREVMINSGLALSPPRPGAPSVHTLLRRPLPTRRAGACPPLSSYCQQWLETPRLASPRCSLSPVPSDPYRSPGPGTPAACTPADSAACPSSNPRLKARPLRNVSYVPSKLLFPLQTRDKTAEKKNTTVMRRLKEQNRLSGRLFGASLI